VRVESTGRGAVTGDSGQYRIANVPPGTYTLTVRRLGFTQAKQSVVVTSGGTATVDVALEPAPTALDEVVTTATGEQRVRELGHVVGRINADSLVREAPVSNISELLNGRVPGLQVFQTSGTVGGEVSLRVRSDNSINLNNEPIVIVDGMRYTSNSDHSRVVSPFNVEPTSRLNDLNPNDIESIEVVKGPSAATLYGTDAANGVIVITTKAGRPGPARWNAYARAGLTEIPTHRHPDSYWGWGSTTSSCTLRNRALGNCAQDSVTAIPNPLNDPELTIFGVKPRWEYGANVSGGREDLRYYFSADFEDATGPLRLPRVMAEELQERLGGGKPPEAQLEPNRFDKLNLRANISTRLRETLDIRLNVGYTQSATRQTALTGPYNGQIGTLRPDRGPYGLYDPIGEFAQSSTEHINRFSTNATADWRPSGWLHTRALLGLDLPNSHRTSLRPRDAWTGNPGMVGDDRIRALLTTGELGATGSFRFGRVSSRTSVGAQYVRNLSNEVTITGSNLRPGGTSMNDATIRTPTQYYSETVTLGSYIEQVVGINDRLFLTGAVRADGASTFGNDYKAAFYPKASISWVVSDEPFMPRVPGLDEFRLRYAFGASGQQPRPSYRRLNFTSAQGIVDGTTRNKVTLSRLPSPDLRPEQVREHEVGLDASAFTGRLQLDLTWNRRQTVDQIVLNPLPTGLGSLWTNLGLLTGRGFEAQLTARLLEADALSWDVMVAHSTSSNTLNDLGDVPAFYSAIGSRVEGYPLGAAFMRPLLGYEDTNGDGIIAPSEVTMGDTAVYVGRGTPGRTQAITSVLGLFRQRVRLSALLERRGDFVQYNQLRIRHHNLARGAVDPTAPLAEQASVIASLAGAPAGQGSAAYTFLEPGDFTRLREVTLTLLLPDGWARRARLSRAALSLSGRNLALWTNFGGPDPESARIFTSYGGGEADNLPQARSWVVRFDLGF
jgi:TonB-linked SusC/RagA family outer membrane protein